VAAALARTSTSSDRRRGALEPALRAEAARLGLGDRVRFLGIRNDVPALLGAVDVCVLTSLYEGCRTS
jgi:glycosyltransferase involved in cell wall biosynthesis